MIIPSDQTLARIHSMLRPCAGMLIKTPHRTRSLAFSNTETRLNWTGNDEIEQSAVKLFG